VTVLLVVVVTAALLPAVPLIPHPHAVVVATILPAKTIAVASATMIAVTATVPEVLRTVIGR
jgi:hypothetical protein